MPSPVDDVNPSRVWQYFEQLSRIPRCSKHEAAIGDFVVATAERLGLTALKDSVGNVVVRKPASPGRERAASICLQGHLDMVCEKSPASRHDFSRDPIELVRQSNVLMANGTTLGADNGIAVATNLAIMDDSSLEHGPLELLFTVDEETGMTGAHNLQPDFIRSRILLNLDSEEEGALYVGCAGGRDTLATWPTEFEHAPKPLVPLEVSVAGLRGGHSGLEIEKGRGNPLKLIARVVHALTENGARLSAIDGGNKRNAIPRDARALLYVEDAKTAAALADDWQKILRAELSSIEPDLRVTATSPNMADGRVLSNRSQMQIVGTLVALPHGVVTMSADIPTLVETSTNVALISTRRDSVTLETSQRSSVASELDDIVNTVSTILRLAEAQVDHTDGYPGWKPNLDSPILRTSIETLKSLYGRDPEVKAVHAGLECGIIGEKYPGIDMVSFGPTLEGVHSPDEKIHLDSVERFWNFLVALLRNAAAA